MYLTTSNKEHNNRTSNIILRQLVFNSQLSDSLINLRSKKCVSMAYNCNYILTTMQEPLHHILKKIIRVHLNHNNIIVYTGIPWIKKKTIRIHLFNIPLGFSLRRLSGFNWTRCLVMKDIMYALLVVYSNTVFEHRVQLSGSRESTRPTKIEIQNTIIFYDVLY